MKSGIVEEPSFGLAMAWSAIEPYVDNGWRDISRWEGIDCPPLVLAVGLMRSDLAKDIPHAVRHRDIFMRVLDGVHQDEDWCVFCVR